MYEPKLTYTLGFCLEHRWNGLLRNILVSSRHLVQVYIVITNQNFFLQVVLLTMAKRLTSLLPRLILHIDFALEWVQVNAGQVIHHQGDESDAIYIVLNGRLRTLQEADDGSMRVVGEYGQGESIGELEVMTESARPATLHAIRDTELAKLPRSLFNSLAQEHPGVTIQISKLIAQRMRALIESPSTEKGMER